MNALFTAPCEFDLAKNVRNYLHFDCADTCSVSRRASVCVLCLIFMQKYVSIFLLCFEEEGEGKLRKEKSDLLVHRQNIAFREDVD